MKPLKLLVAAPSTNSNMMILRVKYKTTSRNCAKYQINSKTNAMRRLKCEVLPTTRKKWRSVFRNK